ncbi:unnamed protein product [marine sediment metagenome]|uniref:Uncharacterized protein n=1 Tax=marine sediment metagenome TaxID=412755 RepID=X1TRY7_9ZZZZ
MANIPDYGHQFSNSQCRYPDVTNQLEASCLEEQPGETQAIGSAEYHARKETVTIKNDDPALRQLNKAKVLDSNIGGCRIPDN